MMIQVYLSLKNWSVAVKILDKKKIHNKVARTFSLKIVVTKVQVLKPVVKACLSSKRKILISQEREIPLMVKRNRPQCMKLKI